MAAIEADSKLYSEKLAEFTKGHKLVSYDTPTKNGNKEHLCINWVSEAGNPNRDAIRDGFSSFNKNVEHPDVVRKMKNTLDFYDYVKKEVYGKN